MPDQRKMIEDYLDELNLSAQGWIVVEPKPGDVVNDIWLQKKAPLAADVLTARIYLPRGDLEALPSDQIKKRIIEGTRQDP